MAALLCAARLGDPSAPLDLVLGECSGICVGVIDAQEGRLGAAVSVDSVNRPARACTSAAMRVS
eukprot:2407520-Prymnesium_polylepis.1